MKRSWTADQVAENTELLADLTDGGTYRDRVTGWTGALRIPDGGARMLEQSPKDPTRARIGLEGPSPKDDRDTEIRMAYLDDIEPVG